ncbi:Gamma-tubulin complex component protein [Kalmanozyma brasiliensis GHG001]|nr:Gamma-tubulin complex component protein [Kalmanozyma brasiliensis GHG001]EST09197.2 Gamma-tubulin complex component protein [Kalmanozyma brasiliensis GHG001]
MSFQSLEVLEVPPLPSLELEQSILDHDQLVSSTFLSSAGSSLSSSYRIAPLAQHVEPGVDPVLGAFSKRATSYELDPHHTAGYASPLHTTQRVVDLDDDPDSSPGPSRRPVRRSDSSSSLSSLDTSYWDEDFRAVARPASVKFRGLPANARVLDLAAAEMYGPGQQDILEAIHERALPDAVCDPKDQHLAPVHPIQHVLRSLVTTATTGTSSDHFQWDADSASFVWSATLQHNRNVRQLRRRLKEQAALHASLVAAGEDTNEQQHLPAAMTSSWIGSERILGWSQAASDSVVRPFLDIGALLRRIDDRILAMHRSAAALCNEAPALAAALDTVVTWLKEELADQTAVLSTKASSPDAASSAILNAHAELDTCLAVLKSLGNLLSCGQPRLPPFRPLAWLKHTYATLSHLHAHLSASLASGAAPLSSAVLAYLLDRTSVTWRQQVARWVGFPGFESDRTGELDDRPPALKSDSGSSSAQISTPWSGAVIDWSLDERGEEDVGYTLKPSAVPSFLPFRHARTFLEAGRALRLLKKAAPEDHPLVHQWSIKASEKMSAARIELPTWQWSTPESQAKLNAVEDHIVQFKRQIARWRRQRRKAVTGGMATSASNTSSPLSSSVVLAQSSDEPAQEAPPLQVSEAAAVSSLEDQFARMSQLFAALPGLTDPTAVTVAVPDLHQDTLQHGNALPSYDEQQLLLLYLSSAACPSQPEHAISKSSFDRVTQASLVAPFESWARLINMSLISVFFQDLGLGTYLETCKQFLLLGGIHFERQVVSSLFDVDQASVLDDASATSGRAVVAMNRRLTAEGVWPPNDSLLSSALNTAVIETVSGMRQAHEDRLHRSGKTEDAVSLAFKDLDERLSFAVVEPRSASSSSKGKSKSKPTWTDPSSIDALDWLTLSFHPPPLISPLLTQVAQTRYQRLWNLLLRIKRCKVAMRAAWACTFKSTSAAFTFDFKTRSLMQQFRWELNHFLDSFGSFVEEIGIESHWSGFMQRLERVRREVSDELASRASSGRTAVADAEGAADGDLDDEALEEEERAALMTSSLELKDVFSLARYHERILDRMLSTCFLKSKQRGVLTIVSDLLQTVLDFSQLCIDFHTPTTATVEPPTFDDFQNLHRYFRSRMDTFVQALIILKDRSPVASRPGAEAALGVDRDSGTDDRDGKRRMDVEAEKARLAQDELEDLMALDVDAAGRSVEGTEQESITSVEMLLGRLNASGFYAELD